MNLINTFKVKKGIYDIFFTWFKFIVTIGGNLDINYET